MTDYKELVERLRTEQFTLEELSIILPKAAAAIEELEKERDYYKQQYENRQRLIKSALGEEWT